jgi:FtsP/CotA-like multicopper oxidase with cupredoxin domain
MKLLSRHAGRVLALGCLTGLAVLLSGCESGTRSGAASKGGAGAGLAANVDVYLRVDQYQIPGASGTTPGPFGNPTPIAMWGFVQTDGTFSTPPAVATRTSVAFPVVSANECDTLIVHVSNNLPAPRAPTIDAAGDVLLDGQYSEPVSVFIPGQRFIPASPAASDTGPTWTDGTVGPRGGNTDLRARSFTVETAIGSQRTYSFGPLKAGTYLIESGTHPAVQVQMGLYGVLKVYPVAAGCGAPLTGRAYGDASSAFDNEAHVLFSEIDPVIHNAVSIGWYGPTDNDSPPPGWLDSTIDYHPKYFLVNGVPFTAAGSPPIPTNTPLLANQRLLLRIVNAGLQTKVPTLGRYMSIIAEDGNFYTVRTTPTAPAGSLPASCAATGCPAPRSQYSVLLPAGKTHDALFSAPAGTFPFFDRRFNLTNNGTSPGGMLALLRFN